MKLIILVIASILAFIVLVTFAPFIILYKIVSCAISGKCNLGKYFQNIMVATTQFGGAVIYGTEDWTTSAITHFMAKYRNNRRAAVFEKIIDFLSSGFEEEHCRKTYDRERKQLGVSEGMALSAGDKFEQSW